MSGRTQPWPEGVPCWAELQTPDLDAADAFYTAVLGWTLAPDDDGRLARRDDHDVARLHAAEDGTATWTLYFAVDDADDTCERLTELGGAVLDGPTETDGARLFLALDLGGAEFGGWEGDGHVGAGARGAPGTLVGADAASGEPGQSRTFYATLFGFTFDGQGDDTAVHHPEDGQVGTLGIAGGDLPHWLVRFGVADLDAALTAATGAGGTVVDRRDRTAVLTDPAGARIGLREVDPG